jgi:hypothetical protein
MAKNKISEYSTTAGANTDISGINIDEGCPPANMNNAIRSLMAALKGWQGGTVTGDVLQVAGGGTGVTSSTGSGSNVLSISPTLTGTPAAPTATTGTNTTQIATTQFVTSAVAAATVGVSSFSAGTTGLTPSTSSTGAITLGGTLAPANGGTGTTLSTGTGSNVLSVSPALTGVPTAPTATAGTNTTQLATTAFVTNARLVVNVKDFGAVGNGVTNDTTAINNCIAANSGNTIYFPAGTYVISGSGINAGFNNISIVGAGMFNTIIRPAVSTTAAITMGSGAAMTNQTISNLTIDCTNASATCTGLRVNNCSDFLADNINIIKANLGIRIQFGILHTYSNFRIEDSVVAAIKFEEGGNDYTFTDGEVTSGITQPTTAGLWITQNTNALRMTNVGFIRQRTSVLIAPTAGFDSTWHFFNNVIFDTGSGHGINIAPTGTGSVRGVSMIGCWSSTNTLDGVRIGSTGTVDGVNIVGHRSYNNGECGYNINSTTCTNVRFNSSEAFGNSVTAPNTKAGFFITGGCSRIAIQDCTSGTGAGFNTLQSYGIEFSLGATTNYMATGNMLLGNGTLPFVDATTPTVTSNVIVNNLL